MANVSVIIPVYNSEKYLKKCLDSVSNQTLKDIEIICVNDCSTDSSLDILNQYSKNDNRIKVINFTKNQGASAARNAAINIAQGNYLGFVDSDDFVDLNFYENLYVKALETNADSVKAKLLRFNSKEGAVQNKNHDYTHEMIPKNNAYFHKMYTSAIYNTSFIRTNEIYFPLNALRLEDHYFSIKAILFYNKVEIINDVNYYYVNNDESVTKNYDDNSIISSMKCLKEIFNLINDPCLGVSKYKVIYNHIIKTGYNFLENSSISKNAKSIIESTLSDLKNNCSYTKECIEYDLLEKKSIKNNAIAELKANLIKKIRRTRYEASNKSKNLNPENSNKISNLKNKYKGKRCFILGGSPSLQQLDLTLLNDECTFTVNRGYKLTDQGLTNSTFHVMSDTFTFMDDKIGNEIPSDFTENFLTFAGIDFPIKEKSIYFDYKVKPKNENFKFQEDMMLALDATETVIYFTYQMALYLGFDKIYLLGVDLDFENNNGHAYKETQGEKDRQKEHTIKAAPIMLDTIKYCTQYLESKGVKCYNGSPVGNIDFMTRVNYKELFND